MIIETYFVMALSMPGFNPPPHREKVENLEACIKKIEQVATDFGKPDPGEKYLFTAACQMLVKPSDPA